MPTHVNDCLYRPPSAHIGHKPPAISSGSKKGRFCPPRALHRLEGFVRAKNAGRNGPLYWDAFDPATTCCLKAARTAPSSPIYITARVGLDPARRDAVVAHALMAVIHPPERTAALSFAELLRPPP